MHSDNNNEEDESQVASPTVQEMISNLRSSFFGKEFQKVAETLVKREQHMNHKYIELKNKAQSFEKEKGTLSLEILKLSDELKKKQTEVDALKILNSEKEDGLKKKQSEIHALTKLNKEYESRARVYKKRFLALRDRVSNLEKSANELVGSVGNVLINLESNQLKNVVAESSRTLLLSEKTDSVKRTEPSSKEIIEIDDDNDDDCDLKCISTFKRKRVSKPLFSEKTDSNKRREPNIKEITKVEDDDDLKCISTLKRKQVSYEIKREHNNGGEGIDCMSPLKPTRLSNELKQKINADCADSISAGNQRRKFHQELHNQPLPSHSRSEGIMPDVKKPAQKNDHLSFLDRSNTNSGPDTEKFNEALKSVVSKVKARRGRWESKDDMLREFNKDDELCMNAICALHRQSILGKSKSSGVIVHAYDVSRITQLAELLTDGDPHQKLKKTASELKHSDIDDCRKFARRYSAQLFNVCQTRYDPFFPPRS